MYQKITTLTEFILNEERNYKKATGSFTLLLTQIENAAKIIASHVKKTGLVDIIGATGKKNTYQEEVQKLDEFSNDLLINSLTQSGQVCAIGSEELEDIKQVNKNGEYIVFFDPLDGSSNIDVSVTIGTIFSIYHKNDNILQKGSKQVAAGYILYGSSVMFVYSISRGVNGFTLDPSIGSFILSHKDIKIPLHENIYSINEGNYEALDNNDKKYLQYLRKNPEKPPKLRYIGSMVADVHRTLLKGGIFMYPKDKNNPNGKLRLLFEVNPLSFIIKQAGGLAISNGTDPLEIKPDHLHQKIPVVLGSKNNVLEYQKFHHVIPTE